MCVHSELTYDVDVYCKDSEEEYVQLAVRLGKDERYRRQVSEMLEHRGAEIWERKDVAQGWAQFLERAHRSALGVIIETKTGGSGSGGNGRGDDGRGGDGSEGDSSEGDGREGGGRGGDGRGSDGRGSDDRGSDDREGDDGRVDDDNTCTLMISTGMKHFYEGDPVGAEKLYRNVYVCARAVAR